MDITVNLHELTERVLGLAIPEPKIRRGGPPAHHHLRAVLMLGSSAAASLACLGLCLNGHAGLALRVFCGATLALLVALQLP